MYTAACGLAVRFTRSDIHFMCDVFLKLNLTLENGIGKGGKKQVTNEHNLPSKSSCFAAADMWVDVSQHLRPQFR